MHATTAVRNTPDGGLYYTGREKERERGGGAMRNPSKPETHIQSLVVIVITVEAMPNPSNPDYTKFSGKFCETQ